MYMNENLIPNCNECEFQNFLERVDISSQRPENLLFVHQLVQENNKLTSKLRITSPLWRVSTWKTFPCPDVIMEHWEAISGPTKTDYHDEISWQPILNNHIG